MTETTQKTNIVDAGEEKASSLEIMVKRAFLAHMNHELRTNIMGIIGYSEMLVEDADNSWIDEFIPDLKEIHEAGKQLMAVVSEMLDHEKIEAKAALDIEEIGADIHDAIMASIIAAMGYAEILIDEATQRQADDLISDLNKIYQASERFIFLVNNFSRMWHDETWKMDSKLSTGNSTSIFEDVNTTIHILSEDTSVQHDDRGGSLLIVDDNELNRDLLVRRLEREGHEVTVASSGREALEILGNKTIDVVLLDIMMPEMNGYQLLQHLKSEDSLRHMPVIMLSALGEINHVIRCIEMGAEDYLPKPFNPVLLKARIGACLEKKRLRDREQAYLEQLRLEREKSERLLLNILPAPIARRLKQGENPIADTYPEVTVLFADIVGFTELSSRISASELVETLNEIFTMFDELAEQYGLEKIKTIGDAYMAVGGLPEPHSGHAEAVAMMAIDMLKAVAQVNSRKKLPINVRIGINTGPVVAGVIGTKKFIYDLWGDTVNMANRMEFHGLPNCIQVTEMTYILIRDKFVFEKRGLIDVKGKGEMLAFLLKGRLAK
jgi:class 3 adenylate cyclase/2-keto-3-deoxy-L-rhamnonate aldolase RhmA